MATVSVIVPTHNRPESLQRLLAAIRQQTFADFEVIVVDDNSSESTLDAYSGIFENLDDRFRLERVPPLVSRGSPAITRNYGIRAATGSIIAFCDDDDLWIREDHLVVAVDCIRHRGADLFFAGLSLVSEGTITNPDWYAQSRANLDHAQLRIPTTDDLYSMRRGEMHHFLIGRTPHANTMVVRKSLLDEVGLYWEKVVFAEDHEFAYRLFANAGTVIYRATATATLDASPHPSVARKYDADERSMFGILATLRAAIFVPDAKLRGQLRSERAWRMLEIAHQQAQRGNRPIARELAAEAFRMFPSATAARFYARLLLSSLFSRAQS